MEKTAEICGLLAQQKEALEQYEAETVRLLTCDIDEIETGVAARQARVETLARLEIALRSACGQAGDASNALYAAAKNKSDRGMLPAREAAIFDAGQQAHLVAVRIRALEEQAATRVVRERNGLVETIKEYNRSKDARASKYYDTARLEAESGAFATSGFGKA